MFRKSKVKLFLTLHEANKCAIEKETRSMRRYLIANALLDLAAGLLKSNNYF